MRRNVIDDIQNRESFPNSSLENLHFYLKNIKHKQLAGELDASC